MSLTDEDMVTTLRPTGVGVAVADPDGTDGDTDGTDGDTDGTDGDTDGTDS